VTSRPPSLHVAQTVPSLQYSHQGALGRCCWSWSCFGTTFLAEHATLMMLMMTTPSPLNIYYKSHWTRTRSLYDCFYPAQYIINKYKPRTYKQCCISTFVASSFLNEASTSSGTHHSTTSVHLGFHASDIHDRNSSAPEWTIFVPIGFAVCLFWIGVLWVTVRVCETRHEGHVMRRRHNHHHRFFPPHLGRRKQL